MITVCSWLVSAIFLFFSFDRRAAPSEGSGVCPFIPLAERHPGLVKRCDAAEGYIDSVCE